MLSKAITNMSIRKKELEILPTQNKSQVYSDCNQISN